MLLDRKQREIEDEEEIPFKPTTFVTSPKSKRQSEKKASKLEVGKSYQARISFYLDGPFNFYIQLISSDNEYQEYQINLQELKNTLIPLPKFPLVGTRCIVEAEEHLYRAKVVQNDAKGQVLEMFETGGLLAMHKDFKIFAMPVSVAKVPPFAINAKIAGLKPSMMPQLSKDEINFYFRYVTYQKVLRVKVVSFDADNLAECSLLNSQSLDPIEDLKRWVPHDVSYTPQKPLRENSYTVIVTQSDSPKDFWVVLADSERLVENFHSDVKTHEPPLLNAKPKDACVIWTKSDVFRGHVIDFSTPVLRKVLAVDDGLVDDYQESEIRVITKEQAKTPPLAYNCCLKEFEHENPSKAVIQAFQDFLLWFTNKFQMEIVTKGEKMIVELRDVVSCENIITNLLSSKQKNYSVGSDWTQVSGTSSHYRKHKNAHVMNNSVLPSYSLKSDDFTSWTSKVCNFFPFIICLSDFSSCR